MQTNNYFKIKLKKLWLITIKMFLLLSLFPQIIYASEFSTHIKTAELKVHEDWYQLKVNIIYHLSPIAIKAIQSSIPLSWCLKIKLKKIQPLWNKTLVSKKYCYIIRYHALLNSYSVSHENMAKNKHFHSLEAALARMSNIRQLNIIKVSKIEKNNAYQLAIKLQLDREALPLPLRPVAYLNSNWDLSSHWYIWKLRP